MDALRRSPTAALTILLTIVGVSFFLAVGVLFGWWSDEPRVTVETLEQDVDRLQDDMVEMELRLHEIACSRQGERFETWRDCD